MRLSCTFFLKPLHWLVELPWLVASNDSRHIDHWGPSSYFNSWNSNVWTKTTSESLVVLYAYCWNLPISRQLPSGDWTVWWLNSLLDWKTIYRSSTWWFSKDLPIFTYNKWCLSSNSLMKKKRPRPAGPRACGSAATFLAAFSSWAVWAVHAMPETQSHINGSQRSYTYVTYINISYHMCIYTYYTHRFWQKWKTYIDYVDINSCVFVEVTVLTDTMGSHIGAYPSIHLRPPFCVSPQQSEAFTGRCEIAICRYIAPKDRNIGRFFTMFYYVFKNMFYFFLWAWRL